MRVASVADGVNDITHVTDSLRKMEALEVELKAGGQVRDMFMCALYARCMCELCVCLRTKNFTR